MSRRRGQGADERFMRRALDLAARGLGRTYPNPPVGAVLVRNGRIVGEGYTRPAGGPHAEIVALRQAGRRAEGADLYVTLEPCTHHGRTPPCTDALLPLRLRRVVVALTDPNPRVRGRGVRRLRAAGARVSIGTGADAAERLLCGHRSLVTRRRPWIVLKLAVSLDGRIALADGRPRWLTGGAARRRGHELRAESDAVLVGARTVRTDDPRLTSRLRGRPDPIRVVLASSRLDVPPRARLLRHGRAPVWVIVPSDASRRAQARLRKRGAELIAVRGRGGRPEFGAVAKALGARGITRLLIEGGGEVAAAALRARVVDEVALFVAPLFVGADGVAAVGPLALRSLARTARLGGVHVERVGADVLMRGTVRYAP